MSSVRMVACFATLLACRPSPPSDARTGSSDAEGASSAAQPRAPHANIADEDAADAHAEGVDASDLGVDEQPVAPDAGATTANERPSTTASTTPEGMLAVAGGTFTMGADSGGERDEHPAHAVTVETFWLDRTEVTQAAYDACVRAGACSAPDRAILASYGGRFRGPNKPVVGISWFDAKAYCTWMEKRLPREAEFERAVRGDDRRRFPWGDGEPTHALTVFATEAPEDVGTHPEGRGPYGHDDLTGNVWEWIDDDYDPYAYTRPGAARGEAGTCDDIRAAQNELRARGMQGFTGTNPIPTECEKNIRGGAYNQPAHALRSTNRIHHPARFKLRMTGVRCAKDIAPATR